MRALAVKRDTCDKRDSVTDVTAVTSCPLSAPIGAAKRDTCDISLGRVSHLSHFLVQFG